MRLHLLALVVATALPICSASGLSGSWKQFTTSPIGGITDMRLSPDGKTLWIGNTQILSPPNATPSLPRVRSTPFSSSPNWLSVPSTGLDNANHDNGFMALWFNKYGDPILRCNQPLPNGQSQIPPPFLFYFDTPSNTWVHATLPAGEEEGWPSAPKNIEFDDNQNLLICVKGDLLQSTDGKVWTPRSSIPQFIGVPSPWIGGKSGWLTLPANGNATNYVVNAAFWQFGMARMPWGELFVGGEAGCYFHSLDNGITWEWADPLMYQPQRDMQGLPRYRNPAAVRLTQLYHAVATKDGEVMFNSDRNGGHNYFILSATGHTIEANAGFPGGGVRPGICTNFVTLSSGDTFMSVSWIGTPTPRGNMSDVLKWDGTSWSIVTPNNSPTATTWSVAVPNSLFSDGANLYVASKSPSAIYKWTPDTSGGAPPVVSIAGGSSATGAPSCALSPVTGEASVQLAAIASVDAGHAITCQWAARGPGAVTFDNANALSPKALFSVPGHYVLNLQITDTSTQLRAGASVIVHVNAATGGTAPSISTQPINQILTPGQPVTFSVQASGSGTLRYQWKRNGVELTIPSAKTPTLTYIPTAADDSATFFCLIANPFGKVVSNCGTLGNPPAIVSQPQNQTVPSGATATFAVAASGTQFQQFQWRRDGVPISGAIYGSYSTTLPGNYSCDVTNIFGSVTSQAGTLSNGTGATFTLNVNGTSSLTATGGGTYNVGTPVGISVEKDPPRGYFEVFDRWTVSGGLPSGVTAAIADPLAASTTVTVTGANAAGVSVTVVANFVAPSLAYLTVTNGLGSTVAKSGSQIDVAALPAPRGMVFDRWIGPVLDPTSPTTKVTLSALNTRVTAQYVPPFDKWQQKHFGTNALNAQISGDLADPDYDGLSNLLEYAFGLDPLDLHLSAQPVIGTTVIGNIPYLTLAFTRDPSATDVTYQVEVSADLVNWTAGSTYSVLSGDTPNTAVTSDITSPNSASGFTLVRDNAPLLEAGRRFMRLRVIRGG